MFQKILVPLDGSRMAAAVLPKVAELAAAMNAQVTLIHVCSRHAPQEEAPDPVNKIIIDFLAG